MSNTKIKIFIGYAPEDKNYFEELYKHFAILKRGLKEEDDIELDIFSRNVISAGSAIDKEIKLNLEKSHVIILFISVDFLELCLKNESYEQEFKKVADKHKQGKAIVIPILVNKCFWKYSFFKNLQVLPKDNEPISISQNPKSKTYDIVEEITNIIKSDRFKEILDINHETPNEFPSPKKYFIGRSQELTDLDLKLISNDIVYMIGIGGVGKTEFLKKFASTQIKRYDKILYLTEIRNYEVNDYISKYYDNTKPKYNVIKELLENKKTLLIWDELHLIKHSADFNKFLKKIDFKNFNSKIVLSSKTNRIVSGTGQKLDSFLLEGLKRSEAKDYTNQVCKEYIIDTKKRERCFLYFEENNIYEKVSSNPLAIESVVKLFDIKPLSKNIIKDLVNNSNLDFVKKLCKTIICDWCKYKEEIKDIRLRNILIASSIFDTPFEESLICEIVESEYDAQVFHKLTNDLFLIYDDIRKKYYVPPLIRGFARYLVEDKGKVIIHKKAHKYFAAKGDEERSKKHLKLSKKNGESYLHIENFKIYDDDKKLCE